MVQNTNTSILHTVTYCIYTTYRYIKDEGKYITPKSSQKNKVKTEDMLQEALGTTDIKFKY